MHYGTCVVSGGATQSLPRDVGVEEFCGDLNSRETSQGIDQPEKCKYYQRWLCTNVSLPHRGGADPIPLPSGGPKWRGNVHYGSDHPSGHPPPPNRL